MARRGRRRAPFKLHLRKGTIYSIASILLIGIGGLGIISFSRQAVLLRELNILMAQHLGWTALFAPFLFISAGLMLTQLKWRVTRPNVLVGATLLLVSLAALSRAGTLGQETWQSITVLVGALGAGFTFTAVAIVGLVMLTEVSVSDVLTSIGHILSSLLSTLRTVKKQATNIALSPVRQIKMRNIAPVAEGSEKKESGKEQVASAKDHPPVEKEGLETSLLSNVPGATQMVWEYPPLSLLSDSIGGKADRGDVKKNADIIEETLESFGIKARVAEMNGGPAVTQYAIEIASGTKLTKITTLQNDLALALAAPTGQIRIEAPIPGRNLVGIEVPNHAPEFVGLKKMLQSKQMKHAASKLAVGLGLNVSAESVIADIERMPHVLIAGATGSGKSVAINAFLCTMLFRASPEEVKFLLIDPKRVELTMYNGIPHLLTPVIVDPAQVVSALKWTIKEMERRYKLFSEVGVRNIQGYNELSGFQAMPYLLIVIDELADIILFAPNDVEDAITRLAQMSRATGIHLIVSTQRPSTDVITGLIKANIPCRIAFSVTSMVDSRVILDTPGAEKLLGRGDMLYIPPDQAKPTRIQGTYVSDQEITNLMTYLKSKGVSPRYDDAVTEKYLPGKPIPGTLTGPGGDELDDFFEQAVQIVTMHDRASASLLQRRLSVGYARAARILDQLQHLGIVGPAEGSKPREVLVKNADDVLERLHEQSGRGA